MKLYLRMDEVQDAINVKAVKWGDCALKVIKQWPESDYYTYMQKYYDLIIDNYSEKYDLTLVVYSGDDDSVCSPEGTQYWLNRWSGFVKDEGTSWLPWRDEDDQLGGYHTIYKKEGNLEFNALHLMTVRTAGHMVPETEP